MTFRHGGVHWYWCPPTSDGSMPPPQRPGPATITHRSTATDSPLCDVPCMRSTSTSTCTASCWQAVGEMQTVRRHAGISGGGNLRSSSCSGALLHRMCRWWTQQPPPPRTRLLLQAACHLLARVALHVLQQCVPHPPAKLSIGLGEQRQHSAHTAAHRRQPHALRANAAHRHLAALAGRAPHPSKSISTHAHAAHKHSLQAAHAARQLQLAACVQASADAAVSVVATGGWEQLRVLRRGEGGVGAKRQLKEAAGGQQAAPT